MNSHPPANSVHAGRNFRYLDTMAGRVVVCLLTVTLSVWGVVTPAIAAPAEETVVVPETTAATASSSALVANQRSNPWYEAASAAVREARALARNDAKARNVIIFVGDGMGITTITAARIRAGQLGGGSGEEHILSFERFPYVALSKTYTVDYQVGDSAATATALFAGVKTRSGVIGVNENVQLGDFAAVRGNELTTILDIAEHRGMATGIVTTTRVTHGTPAALYAKTASRNWEDDADMAALAPEARSAGFPDIARQLVEYSAGNGIDVVLGGGRTSFMPNVIDDPEDAGTKGRRLDGRDLVGEWLTSSRGAAFVWNRSQLLALDPRTTGRVLGLFDAEDMEYEWRRPGDAAGEPSLTEMTQAAIRLLARDTDGFFLMVEGGRIDHAHHDAMAFFALSEAIEFANAVEAAAAMTDEKDTLILVTADHGHVLSLGGYPRRGNPILGLVDGGGSPENGEPSSTPFALDICGLPYTTLSYANGPGWSAGCPEDVPAPQSSEAREPAPRAAAPPVHTIAKARRDLSGVDTAAPEYRQEGAVPLHAETHSGEDVPVYARGPRAHWVHGSIEQHVIFHLILAAMSD